MAQKVEMQDRTVDVVDVSGAATGDSVTLPGEIFDTEMNVPLIHQVVIAQQAARRQGTHATKTRGEVSGGGKKPWRQKGTGRARHGSIRSPQWTGGGIVHGPQPRDYSQRTPKKMIAKALRSALSDRARHDRIHVLDEFIVSEPSTKAAKAALASVVGDRTPLIVLERDDTNTALSLRNLQEAEVVWADQLNTYSVMASDDVIFTVASLAAYLGDSEQKEQDQ